jgi:phospholipid-translocating ATPase
MVISEIVTLFIYAISMVFLPEYFGQFYMHSLPYESVLISSPIDLAFVLSIRFAWKVAVIVAISSLPLYVIKLIKSRIYPAVYSKLM